MVRVERLNREDIDEIMILEQALFERPFSKYDYVYLIQNHLGLKLVTEKEIIAYGVVSVLFEVANLMTIGVKPKYQQEGYGRALLEVLIESAKEQGATIMFLEVRVSNTAAINLYRSFGFKFNRLREKYYGAEDGFEMFIDWNEHNER